MKRCTLDTNIISAFLKKDLRVVSRVSDYLESFDRLTINIISYYEILRGLKDLGNEEKPTASNNGCSGVDLSKMGGDFIGDISFLEMFEESADAVL